MPDTKQTDLTDQEDLDALTDSYVQRRTLTPNEPYTAKVEAIDVKESDEDNIDSVFKMYFKAGGHIFNANFWIKEDMYIDGPELTFLSNVQLEQEQFDPRENIVDQLSGSYINLCFDEDLEHCWCPQTDMDMLIQKVEEVPDTSNPSLSSEVQDFLEKLVVCRTRYRNVLESENIWKLQIESVEPLGEERFQITATEGVLDQELVWEFTLPDTPNPNDFASARLIEHVGNGLPNQLEDSTIYAVNHTDIHPTEIGHVKKDTTDTWYMVTPDDYEEWKNENADTGKTLLNTALSFSFF